jgi:hypothetical protein
MNRLKTPLYILGFILLSGVVLGACSAPAPTQPIVAPSATENSVLQTAAAVQVGDTVATGVAATLTAQAIGTEQSSAALAVSVATDVAATLTAFRPTETSQPSPSPTQTAPTETPTPTPTETPIPTPTSRPIAPLPRPTPTSAVMYPAPYTARPALWDIIVGQNADITFAWRSNVLLKEDERFIVYTRLTYDYDREPWTGWCITAWTQDTQWTSTGDWRHIAPGCFGETISGVQKVIQWKVIIQRYANEQVLGDLSPDSEPSEFIWRPSP